MEDKFIYEGSKIEISSYRENKDYKPDTQSLINEDYYYRFYDYELNNRRQKVEMEVVVGEKGNSPFIIVVRVVSSFIIYDIRYMQDRKKVVMEDGLKDLVWSYLASIVLKLTTWTNKYPAYFLNEIGLDDLIEME